MHTHVSDTYTHTNMHTQTSDTYTHMYALLSAGYEDLISFVNVFFFCNILYVECGPPEVGDIGCDTVLASATDTVYNFSI